MQTTSKEHYLGVDITDDFKDNSTIDRNTREIYARGNMLNSRFGSCTEVIKEQVFLALCERFYCAALRNNYTDSVLTELHVAHNNIFKLLFRFSHQGCTIQFSC